MPTTELRIVRNHDDSVEVIDGEGRTTGALCMGELLEQVIGMIYPEQRKTYPMFTPTEWEQRALARQARIESAMKAEQEATP